MTLQLQHIITAARALSVREKLELLETISHDLQDSYVITEGNSQFWHPRSIEELAAEQSPAIIENVQSLAVDFWPADETADDFIAFTQAQP